MRGLKAKKSTWLRKSSAYDPLLILRSSQSLKSFVFYFLPIYFLTCYLVSITLYHGSFTCSNPLHLPRAIYMSGM